VAGNSSWNIVNFRSGLIRALSAAGYEPVVIAPVDPAAEERIAGLGVQRIVVAMQRSGLNPFADFQLLRVYRRLLKQLRPVAYLGFTIKPNIYGALAARAAGVPAIANISGLGTAFINRGPLLALVSRLYRFALRRTAVVFFQNADDLELFVARRLVSPDQARLLPGSGVDLERFQAVPLPPGPPVFLFIGRLLGDKGVREFVEAARAIRRKRPDARFQLLGPVDAGNRSAIAGHELDAWIAEGCVEYLGTVDDVRPAIAQATAVVLPSYREGLPRSLLEAAAMGRPLIATDVPGCRPLVKVGRNGYLCEAKNVETLAKAMKEFMKLSAAEQSAMGTESRRMVELGYSENVVIAAYLDALGKVGAPGS